MSYSFFFLFFCINNWNTKPEYSYGCEMAGSTKLVDTVIGILKSIMFELLVINLSWLIPSLANLENCVVEKKTNMN